MQTLHIVFDEQDATYISPKAVERSLRDLRHNEKPIVINLNKESSLCFQREWDTFIKVRENKSHV